MNQGLIWVSLSACLGAFSSTVAKEFLNRTSGLGLSSCVKQAIRTPILWVAAVAFAASPFSWLLALRNLPFVSAFGLLIGVQLGLVFLLARRRLRERVTLRHWVGLGCLVLAAGLLNG